MATDVATTDVAVFIDFENLRYGLLNNHGQEPDLMDIAAKANKYGRPSPMRAYADFREHPPEVSRRLQVAGIEAINVPVKRTVYTQGAKEIQRVKNAADMVLALDAVVEAIAADSRGVAKCFLLVTGDADYVKLVALLRNRFRQRVVIAGVPGCTARDLVEAAGESDPIKTRIFAKADRGAVKKAIVEMVRRGPTPLRYWSLRIIDQWVQDSRQAIPGTPKEKRDVIGELVDEKVLVQSMVPDGSARQACLDEARAERLGYL